MLTKHGQISVSETINQKPLNLGKKKIAVIINLTINLHQFKSKAQW